MQADVLKFFEMIKEQLIKMNKGNQGKNVGGIQEFNLTEDFSDEVKILRV